jgi:Zn-dependent membrane protease YugP
MILFGVLVEAAQVLIWLGVILAAVSVILWIVRSVRAG